MCFVCVPKTLPGCREVPDKQAPATRANEKKASYVHGKASLNFSRQILNTLFPVRK